MLLYSSFNALCSQEKWVCVLHYSVKDFRQRRETVARRNASSYRNDRKFLLLQPVPEKMRLELVMGMQNEILDGHHRSLFKLLVSKETWTLTIEEFDLHFDEHFESHFLGNRLYMREEVKDLFNNGAETANRQELLHCLHKAEIVSMKLITCCI